MVTMWGSSMALTWWDEVECGGLISFDQRLICWLIQLWWWCGGGILVTYWILSVSWWGQGEQTGGMGQEKIVGNNIKKIMLNITISSIQMQNNIDLNMVLTKIYYQKNDSVSKFLFFLLLFGPKRISGLVWVVVNYLNSDAIAKVLSN